MRNSSSTLWTAPMIRAGTRVVIVEDCRAGHPATGMYGTFMGLQAMTPESPTTPMELLIVLEDETTIWGFRCWWMPAAKCTDLPAAQAALEAALHSSTCCIRAYNNALRAMASEYLI